MKLVLSVMLVLLMIPSHVLAGPRSDLDACYHDADTWLKGCLRAARRNNASDAGCRAQRRVLSGQCYRDYRDEVMAEERARERVRRAEERARRSEERRRDAERRRAERERDQTEDDFTLPTIDCFGGCR